LPEPLAPDAIVTHGTSLVVTQAQPAGAVTLTEIRSPAAATDWLDGAMA